MKTLKHFTAAAIVLAAMAVPGTAKSVSDQIWDQVNQTTPHRPSMDEYKDALPHRPGRPGADDFKDALPYRPGADEFKEALP